MELTHTRLDLAAYDGTEQPHAIIERKQGELWLVSHSPLQLEQPIDWHVQKKEGHVYIPLVPYLTSPEPDLALAFMFQLGCRVKADMGLRKSFRRLHIVTGHPIHEVDSEQFGLMWQMQLGFGLVLE